MTVTHIPADDYVECDCCGEVEDLPEAGAWSIGLPTGDFCPACLRLGPRERRLHRVLADELESWLSQMQSLEDERPLSRYVLVQKNYRSAYYWLTFSDDLDGLHGAIDGDEYAHEWETEGALDLETGNWYDLVTVIRFEKRRENG